MVEVKDLSLVGMSEDAKKAIEYYLKFDKLKQVADIAKIEPYLLEANHFVVGKTFDCDLDWRQVKFSQDGTMYYCTPFFSQPKLKVRECARIQSVELLDSVAGDSALTGAVLFGAMGAVVGSTYKKSIILIRLHTDDVNEPIVDLHILITPLSKNKPEYLKCFERANMIYGHFQEIARRNQNKGSQISAGGGDNTLETVEKIRKFKELYDEGILTKEEFEAKKKQILGI